MVSALDTVWLVRQTRSGECVGLLIKEMVVKHVFTA